MSSPPPIIVGAPIDIGMGMDIGMSIDGVGMKPIGEGGIELKPLLKAGKGCGCEKLDIEKG